MSEIATIKLHKGEVKDLHKIAEEFAIDIPIECRYAFNWNHKTKRLLYKISKRHPEMVFEVHLSKENKEIETTSL